MKNICVSALGALALVATAASCSQKIELTQGAINQAATVTACVKSVATALPLERVQISPLENLGDSVLTDKQGFAKMTVQAGTHKFRFAATGYASIYESVRVEPLNGESETPIFGEMHADMFMYPMTGTLKGAVVLNGTNDQTPAYAKGATVRVVTVAGAEIADPIETKVGDDGLFSFVVPTEGSIDYLVSYTSPSGTVYRATGNITVVDGQTQMIQTVRLSPISASNHSFDILEAPKTISDPLRITFPVAIDKKSIKDAYISIDGAPLTTQQKEEVTFENSDRTLVIKAQTTDKKWTSGSHMVMISQLKSVEGGNLSVSSSSFEVK